VEKIAVLSGKGGVGKTTISASIGYALAKESDVGLFDSDVSGSNLHLLLSVERDFDVPGEKIEPAIARMDGRKMEFMSLSLISEEYCDWEGAKHGEFVTQVLDTTDYAADYVVEDLAPGWHEDVAMAVENSDVAVLVSLPGKLGFLDLKRTVDHLRDKEVPIAGAYINFSKYVCPDCGREESLFGEEPELEVPIIERIPYSNSLPEIDLDKLLTRLENPVKLEPREGSKFKRKALEWLLRKGRKGKLIDKILPW